MKSFLFIMFLLIFAFVKAQNDSSITLDQLQVPTSPAFNILGISPNSIERPKNPTDFALALGNATSGFTAIPKDYAVEFSPYWIFKKKQTTFSNFKSNAAGKNILQTATISAATTGAISQIDSSEFRRVAIALKFSIFRGELRDEFKKWNDSVSTFLHRSSEILGQIRADYVTENNQKLSFLRNNLAYSKLDEDKRKWTDSIKRFTDSLPTFIERFEKQSEIMAQDSMKEYQESIRQLKDLATRTDFKRYGFKLDFAIGTAMDYPDSNFQTCYVSKFSSWLTMGWENPDINLLGVARFSENMNHKFKNEVNAIVTNINFGEVDYGFRFYKDFTEKFTLSFEYLKRIALYNKSTFEKNNVTLPNNTSRYVFSLNYKVGKNQNLSFVYGKNFDNIYIKQGNLIAALNFLIGFGSSRPFGGK